MSNYWEERLIKQQDNLHDKTEAEGIRELRKKYKQALRDAKEDMSALYDEILAEAIDGKIKPKDYENRANLCTKSSGL